MMEIIIRSIPHGTWKKVETDSVFCIQNLNGFSIFEPIRNALNITQCESPDIFNIETGDDELCFQIHRESIRVIILSTPINNLEEVAKATIHILRVADAEGSESLCLTQFAFLPQAFSESDLYHCLRVAAFGPRYQRLKKICVDVDERHFESAMLMLDRIRAQQKYEEIHDIENGFNISIANAGAPDYMASLAAEILVHSRETDRCIEALKWLILVHLIRHDFGPSNEYANHQKPLEFLFSAMNSEDRDIAYQRAELWLEAAFSFPGSAYTSVPEFRDYLNRKS